MPSRTLPIAEFAAPLRVLSWGRFNASQVSARITPTPRPSTPSLEATIAAAWERALQKARASGCDLFDGPTLRFVSCIAAREHSIEQTATATNLEAAQEIGRQLVELIGLLLRDHVAHCVEHAIRSGDAEDQRQKVKELMDVIVRTER